MGKTIPSGRFEEGEKGTSPIADMAVLLCGWGPGQWGVWEVGGCTGRVVYKPFLGRWLLLSQEGTENRLDREVLSTDLPLRFFAPALACACISLPSYRVDNRDEKQDELFTSPLYDWYDKWWVQAYKSFQTQPCLVSESSHKSCVPSLYHLKIRKRKDKGNSFTLKVITTR